MPTNSPFTLRPATDADIPFACAAHHKGYYDTIIKQFPPYDEAQQDGFFMDNWRARPHDMIVVAGQEVGFISYALQDDCFKVIELILHPDFHGQGTGSAVIDWAKQQAVAAGKPLRLQVLRMNTAYDFYIKNGLRETGRDHKIIYMEWTAE